jgi:hypothetical protein
MRRAAERDPAAVLATQRARVAQALDAGETEGAKQQLETYLDMEERVLFDIAARVLIDRDDHIEAAREHRADVLRVASSMTDVATLRSLLDRHVELTDALFRELWTRLDETGADDLAAALEEARLSREEPDHLLPPRQAVDDEPR